MVEPLAWKNKHLRTIPKKKKKRQSNGGESGPRKQNLRSRLHNENNILAKIKGKSQKVKQQTQAEMRLARAWSVCPSSFFPGGTLPRLENACITAVG